MTEGPLLPPLAWPPQRTICWTSRALGAIVWESWGGLEVIGCKQRLRGLWERGPQAGGGEPEVEGKETGGGRHVTVTLCLGTLCQQGSITPCGAVRVCRATQMASSPLQMMLNGPSSWVSQPGVSPGSQTARELRLASFHPKIDTRLRQVLEAQPGRMRTPLSYRACYQVGGRGKANPRKRCLST